MIAYDTSNNYYEPQAKTQSRSQRYIIASNVLFQESQVDFTTMDRLSKKVVDRKFKDNQALVGA